MGKLVGHVTDVLIDSDARCVSAVEMKIRGRKDKPDGGVVLVPYELIVAVGDILLVGSKK
jgi:sporulation protein YlmC with PRC-barrel domain